MTKPATQPTIHTIGLDIAKTSFAVHGFDADGRTVLKKELKRGQVLAFFTGLAPARVGLEACASAHHWNYGASAFDSHEPASDPPPRPAAGSTPRPRTPTS